MRQSFWRRVGKVSCLHRRPDELDGREFGGIGGVTLDSQPVSLRCYVASYFSRSMCGKAVPDEQELSSVEFGLEIAEQFKKIALVHASRLEPEEYLRTVASRGEHEHSRHRQAFP